MLIIPLVDDGSIQNDTEERFLILELSKLKDLLREKTSLTNDDFGGVDVKGAFSFFNVSKSKLEGVFESFEGFSVGDRKVSLELTKTSKSPDRIGGGRDRRRGGRRYSSRDRRGSSGSRNRSGSRSRRERRK